MDIRFPIFLLIRQVIAMSNNILQLQKKHKCHKKKKKMKFHVCVDADGNTYTSLICGHTLESIKLPPIL